MTPVRKYKNMSIQCHISIFKSFDGDTSGEAALDLHCTEQQEKMDHEDSSYPPHILLVSFPLQGHVNPLLRLAHRLTTKGLLVTFTTVARASLRGIPSSSSDGDNTINVGRGLLRFDFLCDDECSPGDPRPREPDEVLRHVNTVGPAALADVIRRQADAGRPVTCVVNNPFMPWALDVAAAMAIPCALLWIQSCAVFSAYYHYYRSLAAFPSETEPGMPVNLPGLPVLAATELPYMTLPAFARCEWGHVLKAQFDNLHKVTWVLGNTFDELEHAAIGAIGMLSPVIPVGPLVELDDGDDDECDIMASFDCMKWLDSQAPRSVVYVSFGSLVNIGREGMAEVARGLVSTGRPFLWAVRDECRALLPVDCFAGGENGKVVAWSPQERVLDHGAVGCFVTHCGWNSAAEALAAGVPVVAYPWWSDQFTNAKFLVDVYKVGVRLPAPVTCGALRVCVEDVMTGPDAARMRIRAAKWKDSARAAAADGGSSDLNLQAFVDEVIAAASRR